jgi:hypothetical protein
LWVRVVRAGQGGADEGATRSGPRRVDPSSVAAWLGAGGRFFDAATGSPLATWAELESLVASRGGGASGSEQPVDVLVDPPGYSPEVGAATWPEELGDKALAALPATSGGKPHTAE